jgi:hypothetical protein
VELPSKGRLYGGKSSVELTFFTLADVKRIYDISQGIKSDSLEKLVASKVHDYNLFDLAEDYDLYTRIDPTYQLVTLRAFLVSHRKRTGSLTDERRIELGGFIDQIYRNQLRALSIVPTDEELMVHRARHQGEASGVTDFLMKKERWLTKLVEANNQYKSYVPSAFDRVVGEKWFFLGCSTSRIALCQNRL